MRGKTRCSLCAVLACRYVSCLCCSCVCYMLLTVGREAFLLYIHNVSLSRGGMMIVLNVHLQ